MFNRRRLAWLVVVVASLFATSELVVHASPNLYTGFDNPRGAFVNSFDARDDFQDSLHAFGVDTLESLPVFTADPTLTFGATGLTAQSNVKYSISFATLAVSGSVSLLDDGPAASGGTAIPDTFTLNAPVTAFGAFFTNVGDSVSNTISLLLENTLKGTSKTVTVGTYGPGNAFNSTLFAGVTDSDPFNRVTLLESNDYDGLLLDNITAGYKDRVTTLAVTSPDSSSLRKLDELGQNTLIAGTAKGLLTPLGVTHDASGNVYVADALLGKVFQVDPTANVSTLGAAAQGVVNPTGIAPDGAGNLLVTNYLNSQITGLTTGGAGSNVAGPAQGLDGPFHAVRDAAGNTYVANLDAHQIVKIDSLGNSSVFASSAQGLLSPLGLAIDAAGNLFVADVLQSKIFKFTPAGAVSTFANLATGVVGPTSLEFDSEGDLYVANYLGNNIVKFEPNGEGTVFASVARPWGLTILPDLGSESFRSGAKALNTPEPAGWLLMLVGFGMAGARAIGRCVGRRAR